MYNGIDILIYLKRSNLLEYLIPENQRNVVLMNPG